MRPFRRRSGQTSVENLRESFRAAVALYPILTFTFLVWMPNQGLATPNPWVHYGVPVICILIAMSAMLPGDDLPWIASCSIIGFSVFALAILLDLGTRPFLYWGATSASVLTALAITDRTWLAVTTITGYAGFQWWILLHPHPHLMLGASVVDGIPVLMLYQIATGIGVHLSYRAAMSYGQAADDNIRQRQTLIEARSGFESTNELRLRATQRLHETVLNTLRAIGRRDDGPALDIAQRCASDLRTLDEWDQQGLPSTLATVMRREVERARAAGLHVRIDEDRDIVLNPSNTSAVSAIIAELLENVRRHAHALHTTVGWQVLDARRIVLWVQDDGIGMRHSDAERLGIRRVIRESAASMQGQVVINRMNPGTRVLVRLRVNPSTMAAPMRRFALELPHTVLKVLSQSWLVFGLVVLPLVVRRLENPLTFGLAMMAATAVVLLGSITWTTPPQLLLAFGVVVIGGLCLVSLTQAPTCAQAEPLQWLVNILTATCMLGLTFGTMSMRVGVIVTGIAVPFFMVSQIDPSCAYYVRMPAMTTLLMLPTSVLFIRGARAGVQRRSALADEVEQLMREHVRMEQEFDAIRIRWSDSLEAARDVMIGMQQRGSVDTDLRREAEVADARLRAQLVIDPVADGSLAAFALDCVERAASHRIALATQVLDVAPRMDAIPERVEELVFRVIDLASGDGVLKLFVVGGTMTMTLVVLLEREACESLRRRWSRGSFEATIDDCELTLEPQDEDARGLIPVWMSVSRPA